MDIMLKLLRPEDTPDSYVSWLNDPEVTRYLKTKSATRESADEYIRENKVYGIFLDRLIGTIGLRESPEGWFVGIMIGDKNHWGKGYATAALCLLTESPLVATIVSENKRSIRAFEKAGFAVTDTGPIWTLKKSGS